MVRSGLLAYLLIALLPLCACRAADEPPTRTGDSELLSDISVWEGHQLLKAGKPDLAAEAYRKASGYMRTSPYPHFMLARLYLKRSLMDAVLEYGTGVKLMTADFSYQSLLAANLALATLIAIAIAMYIAVVVILMRHARTVWFSILLTFSPVFGEKHLRIIMAGLTVSFLIMLSGLSIVAMVTWAIVIGSGFTWRHASAPERRVLVAFIAFLIAFVPAFDLTSRLVSTQDPASPTKIAARAGETTEAEIAEAAETNNILADNDPIGEFMRGLLYLKTGDYALAIEHFNIASKFTRNNGAILNNIAIALHNLGRYREAQDEFEQALRFLPREAVVHYNYSQTLNALLYYDLAQEELTRASSLDFDLTRTLVTATDRPGLVPMNLSKGALWELAMNPANKSLKAAYHPAEVGWQGFILLGLLTCAAFAIMRNARLPARCYICETVVKAQVAKRKRRELLCPNCKAIKQANADDNDALEKKIEQRVTALETRRGVLTIVLGLLLPGTAYHLLGSRLKGFLITLLVSLLVIFAVSGGVPIKDEPRLEVGHSAEWALILLIAVYALCAWRSVLLVTRPAGEE